MKISGIMILIEKSQALYYFSSSKMHSALKVSDKYYCGIGRRWDGYLEDSAPDEIQSLSSDAKDIYHSSLVESVFTNTDDALSVLQYINSIDKEYNYELAAITSKKLDNFTQGFEVDENDWLPLGVDVSTDTCLPIKEELFARQIANKCSFINHFSNLNKYGLFDNESDADNFISDYLANQSTLQLEAINSESVEFISLYRYIS